MNSSVLFGTDMEAMYDFLRSNPGTIDIFDNYYRTPLMYAISEERTDIMDMLISLGCNVNIQNDYGYTPLHYHFLGNRKSNIEIVNRLINAKAKASLIDKFGNTPLQPIEINI